VQDEVNQEESNVLLQKCIDPIHRDDKLPPPLASVSLPPTAAPSVEYVDVTSVMATGKRTHVA